MNATKANEEIKGGWLDRNLPKAIIALFAIQPLLDILSFVLDQTGAGNTPTLVLRFAMLAIVGVLGFCMSDRKKCYLIFAAACAVLLAGHAAACAKQGYLDPVGDISNFVRVAQMPLFAMCFITFLRRGEGVYKAVETGLVVNFLIITVTVVLSVVTGTYRHTYMDSGIGVLGWFSTSNAQSAIMSILSPVVVMFAYRSKNDKLLLLTTLAAFAQLYFLGTRLAFMAMAVTLCGLVAIMLLRKSFTWKPVIIIGACFLLCCACVKFSPMYRNQVIYNQSMSSKQSDAETMIEKKLHNKVDWSKISKEEKLALLRDVYEFYGTKVLCQRFGTDTVIEEYNYSFNIQTITGTRHRKILFCQLLMDEQDSALSRAFGLELSRLNYNGQNFDPENDFHGVFYLYGWTGLAMMIAFIGYFVYLIVRALVSDWKKYFTLEAGTFGMAFCMALIYAYNTAGVLRRPNSSFYLSALLGVIYYLTMIKDYGEKTPEVLPE